MFVLLALCLLAGCAPAAPEVDVPPETSSPVYTDWSRLTPYVPEERQAEQYTYADTYSDDGTLLPSDGYGSLLPYIGSYLETQSYMGPLCTLGLVTADGRLVTPPVYAEIMIPGSWPDPSQPVPFLILSRGQVYDRVQEEWGVRLDGGFTNTVAAPDGSWVREFSDVWQFFLLDPTHLVLVSQDGSLTVLDDTGGTSAFFPASALEPYLGEGFQWWNQDGGPSPWRNGGLICISQYDETAPEGDVVRCWLDPDTGAVTAEPPEGFTQREETYLELPSASFPGYSWMDPLQDPVTREVYYYGCRTDSSTSACLLDQQGSLVREDCVLPYPVLGTGGWCDPWVWADRIACAEDGMFCYYDLDGNCVFRRAILTTQD